MVDLDWGSRSHPGCVRSVNEDATLAGPSLFAVVDGMGGHAAGEVAASLVASTLSSVAAQHPSPTSQVVREALDLANGSVRDAVRARPERHGMGATVAVLAVCADPDGEVVLVGNLGDARVYRLRDGRLELLSTDHSVVQELVDAGEISLEEAWTHPQRNEVTRALGPSETVEATWSSHEPRAGDRYLLCSDGLHDTVTDDRLGAGLAAGSGPPAVADALVQLAIDAGARDNVSVVVVDVDRVATSGDTREGEDASESTVPVRRAEPEVAP